MDRKSPKLGTFGSLLGFLLLAITSFGGQKPSPEKKLSSSEAAPPQPSIQQQITPSVPSLEQSPTTAPQVSFKNGKLTIVARNSSLGAILQEVQNQTGASIDMPGIPADRVVGQFGPAPAREVLAALLNGSHFNYVLLGSPQNPNSLERVVLLAKSSTADQSTPAPQTTAAAPGMLPRQGAFVVPNDDANDMNSQDNSEDMVEPDQNAEDQTDPNAPNAQPAIKTPQQLLQELQRQRQQGPQDTPPGAPLPNPQQK